MIGSRFVGMPRMMHLGVDRLGSNFHSLTRQGLKKGKGARFVWVKDNDFAIGFLADRDFGILQGIAGRSDWIW
jgi:hypothetical protein